MRRSFFRRRSFPAVERPYERNFEHQNGVTMSRCGFTHLVVPEPGGIWDATVFTKIVLLAGAAVRCFSDGLQFRGVCTQYEANLTCWKLPVECKIRQRMEGSVTCKPNIALPEVICRVLRAHLDLGRGPPRGEVEPLELPPPILTRRAECLVAPSPLHSRDNRS